MSVSVGGQYSTSTLYKPLFHPNLNESVFIDHKEVPESADPQSSVPEKFLEAVEHPKSTAAKDLKEKVETLNQVGNGPDQQLETALARPVQVSFFSFFFAVIVTFIHSFLLKITEFEFRDLLKDSAKLSKEERKRLRSLLESSDEEEESLPLAKKARKKTLKRPTSVKAEPNANKQTSDSSDSSFGKLRFV